jgi:hypothetical protein
VSINDALLEARFMSGEQRSPAGLLLAAMEPAPDRETEFQDWYDTEHFPERRDMDGFRTAARFVCVAGWPRYLALYDLDDLSVLTAPRYTKITGVHRSSWTAHVVDQVWGHYRAAARQLYPGNALLEGAGRFSRLVVWRFRTVPAELAPGVISGLRELYEGPPEVAQVRVFESEQPDGTDYLGIIEEFVPWTPPDGAVAALGDARRHLDSVNTYTRYARWIGDNPRGVR